jgi:type I restriction enzyme S subunit
MSDTPGNLPEGWARLPLGALGEWVGGGTPSKENSSYWTGGSIPWVSPKDMKVPRIRDSEDHITEDAVSASAAKVIPAGSVLVVTRSGILSRTLPVAVNEVPVTVNQDLKCLTPEPAVSSDYVAYGIRAFEGPILKSCSKHGTTVASIEFGSLKGFSIPVAPLAQQHQIVEALDSYFSRLDEVEAGLERVQRNLKRYRASVLQAAVTGRLVPTEAELARAEVREYEPASELLKRILAERRRRWEESGKRGKYQEPAPPDTSNLPDLPEGWCWATLAQLLEAPLINGRSVPTANHGFPVLRLTALKGEQIDLAERKIGRWTLLDAEPFLVRIGDFLVARGNGSIRLVGRGGLVTDSPDQVAFPDTMIRVRIDARHLHPRLLVLLWNSYLVRLHIEGCAKTTAGIHKVNQRDLELTPIPLAPRAEQDRLVAEMDRHETVQAATALSIHDQIRRSSMLRQSILNEAFGGTLVPQS